jgi:hypothetical protein
MVMSDAAIPGGAYYCSQTPIKNSVYPLTAGPTHGSTPMGFTTRRNHVRAITVARCRAQTELVWRIQGTLTFHSSRRISICDDTA